MRKIILEGQINFKEAAITQGDTGDIILSMSDYMDYVTRILIQLHRIKKQERPVSDAEMKQIRINAGQMNLEGMAALPPDCFSGSDLKQKISKAKVKQLM